MASHDPFWGMPEENWQPTSSFNVPIAPPLDDPLVGPLVQLPCVNQQWVPIILGCLSQLTNPGVWLASLTDDQRSLVLNRVDNLRSAMAGTVSTPCCSVQMRLQGCVLQFSVDGGSTWSDVTNWSADFHSCVVAQLPPPLPPNPGGATPDQLACNIAGFLASELIQHTMSLIYTLVQEENNVSFIVNGILAGIGIFFPEIDGATTALDSFVRAVIAQTLSEINTVATDPVLWAKVTCAIFDAIVADGHLTASNVLSAGANILGITYSGHAWVPPALSAYWLALGFTNLLSAQSSGALADVDCTGCSAPWCYSQDFTTGFGHWGHPPYSADGSFVSGVGIEGTADTGKYEIDLALAITVGTVVTSVEVHYTAPAADVNGHEEFLRYNSGSTTLFADTGWEVYGAAQVHTTTHTATVSGVAAVAVRVTSDAGTFPAQNCVITKIVVRGTGTNPFGSSNCT